jgi:magnesium transporter
MVQIDYEEILPDIIKLIENENYGSLLNILVDLHPADIEELIDRLKKEERKKLFAILPRDLASEVLPELDEPIVEQVLEGFSEEKISQLLTPMDSDDAADIVGDLEPEIAEKVLDIMEDEAADEVQELLRHDEESAGGIMALEFIALSKESKVNEAIEKIRKAKDEVNDLYSIWVFDEREKLTGSVSLTELVLAADDCMLKDIMNPDPNYIKVHMDQEEVAKIFRKYDLVSAPVVDHAHRIVGRITIDDIIDVLEAEGSEDIAFVAGAPDEKVMEDSAFKLSAARIPWLLVAFVGELISAFVLHHFEATLQQIVTVMMFVPIVMAMGGSTGQQASVIVVRGLAMGDIKIRDTWKRLLKELRVSFITSLFFSSLLFVIVYFTAGAVFAATISVSLFIVISNAGIVGALVPLTFKRIKIDPALAAAPFISTLNDIVGILIYLSIATFILSMNV